MKKNVKGSALVFSLVVLSMILVVALGVASVSVVEKKNSSATGKSTQAFQVADSAVEVVLKHAVLDPAGTTLDELKSSFNGTVNGTPVVATCDANGVISGAISGGLVDLTFVDAGGATLTDCMGSNLSQVATVKSVGRSGDTTRAINSAVAAGSLNWIRITDRASGWNEWNGGAFCAKDSRTGVVYLKGHLNRTDLTGNGQNIRILTLPDGCGKPESWQRIIYHTADGGTPGHTLLNFVTDGTITYSTPTGGTGFNFISFGGLSFASI